MNDMILFDDDLFTNPTARIPVVLCLDVSGSMAGRPIDELSRGVAQFYEEISDHEVARHAAEIAVVTFSDRAEKVFDFGAVERKPYTNLDAGGLTAMGEGVELALDLLDDRKLSYQGTGVDYHQPWLVLMSDGIPTDDTDLAATRIADLVQRKKLTVFPIGIGDHADLGALAELSPARQPLRLKGLRFGDFFAWLSQSIAMVSSSTPGTVIPLDTSGITTWGTV